MSSLTSILVLVSTLAFANPYPDPNAVPKDPPYHPPARPAGTPIETAGISVLRIGVKWESSQGQERYTVETMTKESSGTPGLLKRAKRPDTLGSYFGQLVDKSGKVVAFDSVGTGQQFRHLTRGMTFRFPIPETPVDFVMVGENPKTGIHEIVLKAPVENLAEANPLKPEVRLIQSASTVDALKVTLYADGYLESRREQFFASAKRVADTLTSRKFPGVSRMEFVAAFHPSNVALGKAANLGLPVKERDAFLGLYFPYWNPFGRWYNVVYPTSERKFRDALASVPYDYPIAIIDDGAYWGVGNFNELTAIPSMNSSFTYLLMHEFGHYFGLNEEYEGGGMTELAFAPGISEPWSQNITFLKDPSKLKWKHLIASTTPVPTPKSFWQGNGPFGAYKGGYADTQPLGHSHKPAFNCVMTNGTNFCPICKDAIEKKVRFDLGE